MSMVEITAAACRREIGEDRDGRTSADTGAVDRREKGGKMA